MEVQQVIKKKIEVEFSILHKLREFENETGCRIKAVNLKYLQVVGPTDPEIVDVHLDVCL